MSSTVELEDELAALRAVVADEGKPLAERTNAAALIVTLTLEAVTEPADDHPEVVTLVTPWDDGGPLSDVIAHVTKGLSRTGYPLAEARAHVLQRHKLRAVLALIVDTALPRLIRLAACQAALDGFLHPNGRHRVNAYSPERLLAAVKLADGFKWTSKGREPVERPPRVVADVWEM
jgi:hypothetical protein